jgi:hypothetical protein
MKSLQTAALSALLLVTGLAFGQDTANLKFPANANDAVMAPRHVWRRTDQTS